MKPLAISSYTVTSAVGRGRAAHIAALRAERTGLAEQRFEDCDAALLDRRGRRTRVGRHCRASSRAWDCRNNRLAELALGAG